LHGAAKRLATAAERVYCHEGESRDMVIWESCGVLHRVCPDDPASPREMHRTVLMGDEVGAYSTLAMAFNTLAIQPDPQYRSVNAPAFPQREV
jgi:hypothetical protein